jgi:hypothetical protein
MANQRRLYRYSPETDLDSPSGLTNIAFQWVDVDYIGNNLRMSSVNLFGTLYVIPSFSMDTPTNSSVRLVVDIPDEKFGSLLWPNPGK